MSTEIFKLQRPMFTTEPQPMMLAYNKDRSKTFQMPMDKSLLRLFRGEYKIYALCEVTHDELLIGEKCEEQDW